MKIFKDKSYNWYLSKYDNIIEVITMDKKMIETAKKYGTDSFEYFKAGCDIFNREELLERLFETTKEVMYYKKRNKEIYDGFLATAEEVCEANAKIDKAIELLKEAGCYDEEAKTFCDDIWEELPELLNILQGSDE